MTFEELYGRVWKRHAEREGHMKGLPEIHPMHMEEPLEIVRARAIIEALRTGPKSTPQIVEATGLDSNKVRNAMQSAHKMARIRMKRSNVRSVPTVYWLEDA